MKVKFHALILTAALFMGAAAGAATQVVEGESWNGAKYQLAVPDEWNGDLVVYAHGYVDLGAPLVIPTEQDRVEEIREMLLANGYAVACSSYSKNGFAVREGTLDTLCLNWYFKKQFGKPARTFLMGHSLGGLVCVRLAEALPRHYDGVLTVSGMIGGSKVEIEYISNVRVLFELNYPGVLPGAIDDIPLGLDLMTNVVFPIIGTIEDNATNAVAISMIDQTPIPWTNGTELVTSYVYALGFYYRGFHDMVERTRTPHFFDNSETVYTSWNPDMAPLMDIINAHVPRFETTRYAKRYFRRNYESTGRMKIPMLGIHNARDPVVPASIHQTVYAEKVARRRCSRNLVQRQVDRHGHTENFTPEEVYSAFEDLVEWVDTGVKAIP